MKLRLVIFTVVMFFWFAMVVGMDKNDIHRNQFAYQSYYSTYTTCDLQPEVVNASDWINDQTYNNSYISLYNVVINDLISSYISDGVKYNVYEINTGIGTAYAVLNDEIIIDNKHLIINGLSEYELVNGTFSSIIYGYDIVIFS